MAGPFGVNFAPTADNSAEAGLQQAQIRRTSTPLEVLNLQLPTTINPRAPASRTLLEPKPNFGGGINPDAAVLASIVRALTGSNAPLPGAGMTSSSVRPQGEDRGNDNGGGNGSPQFAPSSSPVHTQGRDPGPSVNTGGGAPTPINFGFELDPNAPPTSGPPTRLEPVPGDSPQGPFGVIDVTPDDWAQNERRLNNRGADIYSGSVNVPQFKQEQQQHGPYN